MPRDRKWHRDTRREWRSWYASGVPATWTPAQHVQAKQLLFNVEAMHRAESDKERRIVGNHVRVERNGLGLGKGRTPVQPVQAPAPDENELRMREWNRATVEHVEALDREVLEGMDLSLMPGYVQGEPVWVTTARYLDAVLTVDAPQRNEPGWHAEVRKWVAKRDLVMEKENARISAEREAA